MKDKVLKFLKELIPYILIIIVVLLFKRYIVSPIRVNGQSMYPTLKNADMMILNETSYYFKDIKRFDIVVVDAKDELIIKRVIALPGETISYKNNTLYINGKKVEEKYSYGITDDFESVKLKKDEYFVMGDNRQNSLDSRYFGPFKKKYIRGKTNVIFLPFDRMGKVK
jgi:signal peptidase I